MPSTFSYVVLHIIFATKHREAMIDDELRQRLFPFIGGIIRERGSSLIAIGGMPDHVHMLVRLSTEHSIGDLMRHVKSRSSMWVHQEFEKRKAFAWQEGYGVFSTNRGGVAGIERYIHSQEEHHTKKPSLKEFTQYLESHGLEYDIKYLLGASAPLGRQNI